MMMPTELFEIKLSDTFKKEFKKLSGNDQIVVTRGIKKLRRNPDYRSLNTKKVNGQDDLFESRMNIYIRLIWQYDEGKIHITDVGHHDILKKY